ncbi:unnamed protein product [Thlaspi arvense]|uniref:NAC domain-containing protein n=1 Tax=Thlaspi arvense TaxID=13288 RepID=A0AAU9SLM0_THLAR|nr:unnamed protein product [Thlaspi arvense]
MADEYGDMIYFDPYDDELINSYLIPKLKGTLEETFILDMDVYAKEPWLLHHTEDPFFKKDEWYYFVTRTQVSAKNNGCGKKAKRKINDDNDRGCWKANAKENIIDYKTRKVIGVKQTLTFTKSNENKKRQKRGDGTCSCAIVPRSNNSWIMTEYMLPGGDQFQELVLCKIHEINKSKKKDDHHEASTCCHPHHLESCSSEQQPINTDHESSLEQQQPLSCGGNGPEIPHLETTRNMVHQKDADSKIEMFPERSAEKDAQAEDTELEDWIADLMDKFTTKEMEAIVNDDVQQIPEEDDQQRPLITALPQTSAPPPRLGDNSLPIELDDDEDEATTYHHHLASFSSQKQPINICKIQEKKTVVRVHSFSELISEAHRHDPVIPRVGSEKSDQVLKTSPLTDEAVKETNGEESPLERCENLGSEKDNQLHMNAPLVRLGSEEEAKTDWLQDFVGYGSGLHVEEDDQDVLNYNTSWIDPDLLDQYATLRPQERL